MTGTVIRTVVITLPTMISDIVEELFIADAELDIVERCDTRKLIEDKLRAVLPDLVLLGLSSGESWMIAQSVLAVVPDAKLIAFSSDGASAYVSDRDGSWTALTDFSPGEITGAIRAIRKYRRI
jgi:hypothetical protein